MVNGVKSLVVFYSRTGTTKKVAEAISSILECDVEEVFDTKNRAGFLGYTSAGREATSKRLTTIRETKVDPFLYDLVIIGTPIWASTISSPIRTYLSQNKGRFKQVAFFCTFDDSSKDAFAEMEEFCGKPPLGLLELRRKEVERGEYSGDVRKFVETVSD